MPVSAGGKDELSNLAFACHACNLYKGAKVQHPDPQTNEIIRLFDPRQDIWSNHFKVDLPTNEIHGISSIGRATIACLKVNNHSQLIARKKWIRYELFP